MADKPAGGLSLRIGLMLSELQSDFLAAEQTVKQGIAALNRQQNIVKLKMVTDITGLDSVTDKTKILEVQEQSLTQLLEMQRDKLKLATAAYQESAQSKGVNATATKNLETAMERERLAVARLEAQLKELSAQKISMDITQLQDSISKINAKIQHVKLTAEIDTSKLKDAGSVFDTQKIHVAALTKELELQRQKLIQLREAMYQSAKTMGGDSVQTLNIKSNVLQQIQEISKLEAKLKELSNTNINLQVRSESLRQAEQTISDSIARINARIEHIKVKTEIDVSKLASATSEFDKARTHVQGLNRELELQNQKLAEMRKALSTSISVNGISNVKTISLSTDIQRQIQEIDKLKAKIQELNNIPPPKTNSLLSGYLNIKGDVTGKLQEITNAFSQLKDATSSVDSAITSALGIIETIPSPVGKAFAALTTLPIVFKGIENSILDMTKAAASAGDSVYVMSRGFQMSFADTAKFTTMCKVAGVEVNDLASTIKITQRQIVRGGEDARAEQWLKRYGETAFDASGRLKDLNEMALALSRGLKKAQAEGNGMSFILATMRNASADTITALEDLEGNYELAAKIVKNGLANPALAHEVQGNLNALNTQAAQMNATFESALLPVANEIIPKVTERMGKMTTLIKDNKDVILDFGRDFAQVWRSVEETVDKVAEGFSYLSKLARENRVVRQTTTDDIVKKYKDNAKILTAKDLVQIEIESGGYTDDDIRKLQSRSDLYNKELKRATVDISALYAKRREEFAEQFKPILEKYKGDKDIKTMTDLLNKLTDAEKQMIANSPSDFFGSLQEKVAALNLELKKLNETAEDTKKNLDKLNKSNQLGGLRGIKGDTSPDLDESAIKAYKELREKYDEIFKLRHNEYQNQIFEINKKHGEVLNSLGRDSGIDIDKLRTDVEYAEKHKAIYESLIADDELRNAELAKIEQEQADKLQEIRDRIAAADNTALQNKIAAIEEEKEAWLSAGMEEAEAESLAQKQLSDYIKSVEEELSANIEALHQTDLEKRIAQIEREKQAWIDKGASASQAEQFAQEKIRQENQKTEDKLNQIRNSVASLYKTDLENKLDAIETEKKAWIEAGMEEVEAEELAQQKIQHIKEEYLKQQAIAEAEYLDKLAKAEEEYLSKVQAAQEEADRKNKARRDEALNVAKQEAKEFEAYLKGGYEGLQKLMYNKLIKSGVNPELLKAMTPEKLDAYENAKEKATQSFLPNWKDPYEPNMPKKPVVEIPDILVKVPQSAENTARSLDNLATSADKAANNLGGGGEPFAPAENVWTGDSSGAVASYRQPDGSVKIENYYDSVKKAEPIINVVGDGSQNESSNYTVLEQSSQELSTAVQSTTESLGELPTIVQGVSASLSEIMGRYSELPDASAVSQSFSEMPTVIQTAIDSFRDLPITISDVTEKLSSIELPQFYDMSQSVQEVTVRINDFSNALSNFLSNVSYNGTTSEQKTPVNVSTSVQIEEAHAWDYDHIQELAEKVADILKPAIISAIGGDSNSY